MLTKVRSQTLEIRSRLGKTKKTIFTLYFLLSIFCSLSSKAQCAMCRAAVESEGNATKAEAINDGIVYLMIIPYLLVGAIGYAIFRMYKNKKSI